VNIRMESLVDLKEHPAWGQDGELVGINLAAVLGAQNSGFAVPLDKVLQMLMEPGKNPDMTR
jgi:hypothetical protein